MINFDVLSPAFNADNPDFDCQGDICGSGRLAWLVPDIPFGVDLRRACGVHDHRFETGTCIADWRKANVEFWDNVQKLCVAQGKSDEFAITLADFYYAGVSSPIGLLIFEAELCARQSGAQRVDGSYSAGWEIAQLGQQGPLQMPGLRNEAEADK